MTENTYQAVHEGDQTSIDERTERRRKSIADTLNTSTQERLDAIKKHEAMGMPVTPQMNLMAGYAQIAQNAANEGNK